MERRYSGPGRDELERIARAAIAQMPAQFREHLTDVVVKIEEFATREVLSSVELECKWQLTGLYEGHPLTERSIWESGGMPPAITLFRQPLLAEMADTGVELEELVRHVVVHEAGHHFGFSDEDMHALEDRVED